MQELLVKNSTVGIEFNAVIKRVTGRKARDLQMEEIGCKCQTFFFNLPLKQQEKQTTSVRFFSLRYTILKDFS